MALLFILCKVSTHWNWILKNIFFSKKNNFSTSWKINAVSLYILYIYQRLLLVLKRPVQLFGHMEEKVLQPPVAHHVLVVFSFKKHLWKQCESKLLWWYDRDLYIQTTKLNVLTCHWVFLSSYVPITIFHLLELLLYFLLISKFFPLDAITAHAIVILCGSFLIFQKQQY